MLGLKLVLTVLLSSLVFMTSSIAQDLNVCLMYMTTNYPNSSWQLQNDGGGAYIKSWSSIIPEPTTNKAYSVWPQAAGWYSNYWRLVKQTQEWKDLRVDIDQYPLVKSNFINSVGLVTDLKTKAALNDARALIQHLQQEIVDLKSVIGKLNQYEP